MHPFYSRENFEPWNVIGYLLRRVHKLSVSKIEEAVEAEGLTLMQWVVLFMVSTGTATTGRDLSRHMRHDQGAITRIINTLEEREFLFRSRNGDDRRQCNLELTASGRTVLDLTTDAVIARWNDILGTLDHRDVAQMIATLSKLLAQLEDDPHPASRDPWAVQPDTSSRTALPGQ